MAFSQTNDSTNQEKSFSIRLEPVKWFQNTFAFSIEKSIGQNLSISAMPLITYGSKNKGFVRNLEKYDLNASLYPGNYYYSRSTLAGGGLNINLNYFFDNDLKNDITGLYFSFSTMFWRISIYSLVSSSYYDYNLQTYEYFEKEVCNNLNIYYLGIKIGYTKKMSSKFCISLYLSNGIKLSRYDGFNTFTQYSSFGDLDYSGISTSAGISFGLIK